MFKYKNKISALPAIFIKLSVISQSGLFIGLYNDSIINRQE